MLQGIRLAEQQRLLVEHKAALHAQYPYLAEVERWEWQAGMRMAHLREAATDLLKRQAIYGLKVFCIRDDGFLYKL